MFRSLRSACVALALLAPAAAIAQSAQKPSILYIVADDLGWDDVGFRSKDLATPTIDQLANDGAVLTSSMSSRCARRRARP